MVSALDLDASILIPAVAGKLKKMFEEKKIEKPYHVGIVKDSPAVQRPPDQGEDFWYIRCAAILRQAYKNPIIGISRLRRHFGDRKRGKVKPEHFHPAGGSTIRKALQALEKAGLLEKAEKGRKITPQGRALLDKTAKEVAHGQ